MFLSGLIGEGIVGEGGEGGEGGRGRRREGQGNDYMFLSGLRTRLGRAG